MSDRSYEEIFDTFWAAICVNPDGTLNADQVKRELADYYWLLEAVPRVYCHVTNSRISKPNTLPEIVISVADDCEGERWQDRVDEFLEVCESVLESDTLAEVRDLAERVF